MSDTDSRVEHEARLRQIMADALLKEADFYKRVQDIRAHPLILGATCFGAGAAVVGAFAAVIKLLG